MRSKKAIYNIVSTLVLQVVIVLYGFIVPKIIINKFGSDVNGLISSITQFLAYISLLESGFGPVVKAALYKPIANKDKKTIAGILKTSEKFFKTIAYIFLVYIILLSIFYPLLVSNNFGYLYTISLIIIIAISTFAEYFFGMTYKLYLQADQRTYVISIIQILTYFFSTILIIVMAKLGMNIQVIKLVSGVIFVLRPILQNLYVKKKYQFDLENNNKYELKQKWDGLAQHIAAVIHGNTDVTILTFFCKLSEVSVYSVYYLVVKGVKSIIQAFSSGIDASFGDMIAKGEHDNLNRKFGMYEVAYFTVCTIVFSCTMVLIVPFVRVYTKGITDANYVRYLFGYLIVISEYIWAIRLPYSSITLAAGHFKETRVGAWVEAITNIVVSLIFVKKFGIIGVTIGTIVGMTIRTIEFVFHTNKYILKRNIFVNLKKISLIILETIIIAFLANKFSIFTKVSYFSFILNAIVILVISSAVTLAINSLFYKSEFKSLINVFKRIVVKKTNKSNISNKTLSEELPVLKENLNFPLEEKETMLFTKFDENESVLPKENIILNKEIYTDRESLSNAIRNDNSYIKNIDFNYNYNFNIVDLILEEIKIYNYKFNNEDYLRDGKYPIILSNNHSFMKYVIDKDFNNIFYIDSSNMDKNEINGIINYTFKKLYSLKEKDKNITFNLDKFKNSDIVNNNYFIECLKYIK